MNYTTILQRGNSLVFCTRAYAEQALDTTCDYIVIFYDLVLRESNDDYHNFVSSFDAMPGNTPM